MNERPIIFSGDMVRATLDGRMTQHRVAIKPQPHVSWTLSTVLSIGTAIFDEPYGYDIHKLRCPFGQPCDRLWVREAFRSFSQRHIGNHDIHYPIHTHIPAYPDVIAIYKESGADFPQHFYDDKMAYWKPSIFMPRWASRILLEITGIRVERVQDISETDAISEGMTALGNDWLCSNFLDYKTAYDDYLAGGSNGKPPLGKTPRKRFHMFWDSINAKRGFSWDANPWVWVISFKKLEV